MLIRVLVFAAGFALTAWTVASAVRTVILPRSAQSVLSRVVFRSMRIAFRMVAGPSRSFSWRDRVMAYFGPVGLLTLVGVWLALVTVAFTLMFWAVEQQGWSAAYHESGSSLLTLGFAGVEGAGARTLAFIEAALGLALLALLITYLPTLYGSFSRRESLVALLEVRAGTPPSALGMLERFHRIGWTDRLSDLWTDWERWFAEVEESHTAYPVLAFFRSPQPDRHWVTAAGTVLDAAALSMAVLDVERQPQAALAVRAGYISLRRIADTFGIEYDPYPAPDDPISITREEFGAVVERLEREGVALVPDREQAWRAYSGWRVNYDTVLLDLAELTMAPYAPWTSDRSTPRHRRPKMRRWGRAGRSLRLEP